MYCVLCVDLEKCDPIKPNEEKTTQCVNDDGDDDDDDFTLSPILIMYTNT